MSGKKSFAAAAVCLLAVFAFAGMSCAGEIAMGSAKYLEDVMDHFKEVVEKESGGKITVKNLKASAFEDEVGNIELVMNGGLTATVVGINKLGVSPSMGFVSFPYMFPSLESADRVFLSPFMDKVNARLRTETKAGGGEILGVSWFTNDYRVLTADELKEGGGVSRRSRRTGYPGSGEQGDDRNVQVLGCQGHPPFLG